MFSFIIWIDSDFLQALEREMVGESIVRFCSGWLEPSLPSAQLPVNVSPLVGTLAGRSWRREQQYTFAADGGYNKVQHLVLYLYYTFTPDGRYNKVKTLVGQAGEVWHTVLVVFGRNNGFTGWTGPPLQCQLEDKSRERQRCTVLRNDETCSTPQHLVAWGEIEVEREGALAPNGLLLC